LPTEITDWLICALLCGSPGGFHLARRVCKTWIKYSNSQTRQKRDNCIQLLDHPNTWFWLSSLQATLVQTPLKHLSDNGIAIEGSFHCSSQQSYPWALQSHENYYLCHMSDPHRVGIRPGTTDLYVVRVIQGPIKSIGRLLQCYVRMRKAKNITSEEWTFSNGDATREFVDVWSFKISSTTVPSYKLVPRNEAIARRAFLYIQEQVPGLTWSDFSRLPGHDMFRRWDPLASSRSVKIEYLHELLRLDKNDKKDYNWYFFERKKQRSTEGSIAIRFPAYAGPHNGFALEVFDAYNDDSAAII
jgi:hypothetical protein